ncbi:MAG: thiamine pyrophosphate-binding protein [Myxococcaceae bacterium]|nr:MAG: thiamine pyrophosphate-binding protein [Myxococcaceae bacterium]
MSAPTKVRVADYIASFLAGHGVRDVFLVTGGGAMHLNDAFGRERGLRYFACHHEQACATAAESYSRASGRLAAVNVTTGPGGTNAITGVWGAWVDSIPMFVVSGQVKFETVVRSTELPLRQLGDQEIDIVRVVSSMTKYAVMVTDASTIRYHLERALHLATHGRPGPVWLDIPMNIQGSLVDPAALAGYDPVEDRAAFETTDLDAVAADLLRRLRAAERPVLLVGTGVRASGTHEAFLRAVERLGIPVAVSFNALDALWADHPHFIGRQGTIGDRAGNFAVQNADLLLVLGCRLNIRQISYGWQNFARHAFKVMVDVDAAELRKPTLSIDLPVHADLRAFFPALDRALDAGGPGDHASWLAWCQERARRYPVVLPEYWKVVGSVNPYCFMEVLFRELPEGEVVVSGDGTASVTSFQAARLKKGQRLYHNSGSAPMGFDLPAAIGAAVATGGRVVCLAGDGSIQMNLQELQTIVTHRLPIKIFVLNNRGYHSIRQTQHNYFPDNIVGCGTESGLGFPDFGKLAWAYGIPFRRVDSHDALDAAVRETLDGEGPQMCEVFLDLEQVFAPKLSSRRLDDGRMISSPLEDLAPFLSRDELRENMIVPLLPDE